MNTQCSWSLFEEKPSDYEGKLNTSINTVKGCASYIGDAVYSAVNDADYSVMDLGRDLKYAFTHTPGKVAVVGTIGAAVTALTGCGSGVGPSPIPTDYDAPVITLNGESSVVKTMGNTYVEQGAITDDGSVVQIAYPTFDKDGDGIEDAGFYLVKYNSVDSSGNGADEVTRTVENRIESAELENILNRETVDGMTVAEKLKSLGKNRVMGTENIPNIEGDYVRTGTITFLDDGIGGELSLVDSKFYNQNNEELKISQDVGISDYTDAIITGDRNNFSIYRFHDQNRDGVVDEAHIYIGEKLSSEVLGIERTMIILKDNLQGIGDSITNEVHTPKD